MTLTNSQRALAGLLGISHQRVGRYLHEGEEHHEDADGNIPVDRHGNIRRYGAIPDYLGPQIDYLYEQHVQIVREQARIDRLPFLSKAPVYQERRYMRNGEKGDRVISGNTEYIRKDLRDKFIANVVSTKKFHKVNVRSRINLKRYADRLAGDLIQEGRRNITQRKLSNILQKSFNKENEIIDATEPYPLFTKSVDTLNMTPAQAIYQVEWQLTNKHSPATGEPGTRFAYEYLLQALPLRDANGKIIKRATRRRRTPATKSVAGNKRPK